MLTAFELFEEKRVRYQCQNLLQVARRLLCNIGKFVKFVSPFRVVVRFNLDNIVYNRINRCYVQTMHMGRLNYRLSLSVSINTWRRSRHQSEVAQVSGAFNSLKGGVWVRFGNFGVFCGKFSQFNKKAIKQKYKINSFKQFSKIT